MIFPVEQGNTSVISTGIAPLWLPQFCVALIGYLPWYKQGTLKLLGIITLNPSLQCFSDVPELLHKLSFMCSSDEYRVTSDSSLIQFSASSIFCSAGVVKFAVLSCLSLKAAVGKILGKFLH